MMQEGATSSAMKTELPADRARMVQQLRALWDSRRALLSLTLLGACLTVFLVLLIPSRYESTAQLMPPDGQSGAGSAVLSALAGKAGGLGGLAGDALGVKNSGALFVAILGSRTVQDRLIVECGLRRVYGVSKMEDARMLLLQQTRVAEDRKSGIVTITVTDIDPNRAAILAQAYVNALDLLVEQVSTSSARRERIFLEERLKAVKLDLDSAAEKFSQFASKNTAIDIPEQSKAMVEAAAALQGQLIAAESELRGLEAMYTEQNVRVRSLRARVTELRAQLGKMGGDGSSFAGSQNDASFYPAIRQLPLLGVTYADLFRQTKIQETVFELLTQQYELAKVQEAKEVPTVKLLDAPVVPTKKAFPPRTLFTVAGTMCTFLLACAWTLGKGAWRGIDPNDPGKQFAMEVAGTLRAEAARFAPAVTSMNAFVLKLGKRGSTAPPEGNESAAKAAKEAGELSRATRNSLG